MKYSMMVKQQKIVKIQAKNKRLKDVEQNTVWQTCKERHDDISGSKNNIMTYVKKNMVQLVDQTG